jgi:hypothetical protein
VYDNLAKRGERCKQRFDLIQRFKRIRDRVAEDVRHALVNPNEHGLTCSLFKRLVHHARSDAKEIRLRAVDVIKLPESMEAQEDLLQGIPRLIAAYSRSKVSKKGTSMQAIHRLDVIMRDRPTPRSNSATSCDGKR